MLTALRSLLVVIEEGGVNRAARRLGATQPTVTRHIQSLEQEFGAPLFERTASGMRPTDLGFFVRDKFGPLLRQFERAHIDAITFAHGRHEQLRVGFIGLAAARYLNTALERLGQEFPNLRLMLSDLSPGEQLEGLREGRLDVALSGQEIAHAAADFYQRRAAQLGVIAVLPADNPLARRAGIPLDELRGARFIGVAEHAVPGRNDWIRGLCAKAGFRAKLVANTENISETFALVAGEGAVALLPDYLEGNSPPGTARVRITDRWARWWLVVLRQRGRGQPAARRLFDLIGSDRV